MPLKSRGERSLHSYVTQKRPAFTLDTNDHSQIIALF